MRRAATVLGLVLGAAGVTGVLAAPEAPVPAGAAPETAGPLTFGPPLEAAPPKVREQYRFPLGGVVPALFPSPDVTAAIPADAPDRLSWEASLAAREQALVRAREALLDDMRRLQDVQKAVDARWAEAMAARRFAEEACGAAVVGGGDVVTPDPAEREARVAQVTEIVKKMKPSLAAALVAEWDDGLAVDVLRRLPARASAPIVAALPAPEGARLTRRLATGQVARPVADGSGGVR